MTSYSETSPQQPSHPQSQSHHNDNGGMADSDVFAAFDLSASWPRHRASPGLSENELAVAAAATAATTTAPAAAYPTEQQIQRAQSFFDSAGHTGLNVGPPILQQQPTDAAATQTHPPSAASASASTSAQPAKSKKEPRHMWSEEETQALVTGCTRHGVGNWKAILHDPDLRPFFSPERHPGDLKDRFRTKFPAAYHELYPNAKTHITEKASRKVSEGSRSQFEKGKSKERRCFTPAEDAVLKQGYDVHGSSWTVIAKDPIFEGKRKPTDLRDRFRNAFPDLYEQAGYKPRLKGGKSKDRRLSHGSSHVPHSYHDHAVPLPNKDSNRNADLDSVLVTGPDGKPTFVRSTSSLSSGALTDDRTLSVTSASSEANSDVEALIGSGGGSGNGNGNTSDASSVFDAAWIQAALAAGAAAQRGPDSSAQSDVSSSAAGLPDMVRSLSFGSGVPARPAFDNSPFSLPPGATSFAHAMQDDIASQQQQQQQQRQQAYTGGHGKSVSEQDERARMAQWHLQQAALLQGGGDVPDRVRDATQSLASSSSHLPGRSHSQARATRPGSKLGLGSTMQSTIQSSLRRSQSSKRASSGHHHHHHAAPGSIESRLHGTQAPQQAPAQTTTTAPNAPVNFDSLSQTLADWTKAFDDSQAAFNAPTGQSQSLPPSQMAPADFDPNNLELSIDDDQLRQINELLQNHVDDRAAAAAALNAGAPPTSQGSQGYPATSGPLRDPLHAVRQTTASPTGSSRSGNSPHAAAFASRSDHSPHAAFARSGSSSGHAQPSPSGEAGSGGGGGVLHGVNQQRRQSPWAGDLLHRGDSASHGSNGASPHSPADRNLFPAAAAAAAATAAASAARPDGPSPSSLDYFSDGNPPGGGQHFVDYRSSAESDAATDASGSVSNSGSRAPSSIGFTGYFPGLSDGSSGGAYEGFHHLAGSTAEMSLSSSARSNGSMEDEEERIDDDGYDEDEEDSDEDFENDETVDDAPEEDEEEEEDDDDDMMPRSNTIQPRRTSFEVADLQEQRHQWRQQHEGSTFGEAQPPSRSYFSDTDDAELYSSTFGYATDDGIPQQQSQVLMSTFALGPPSPLLRRPRSTDTLRELVTGGVGESSSSSSNSGLWFDPSSPFPLLQSVGEEDQRRGESTDILDVPTRSGSLTSSRRSASDGYTGGQQDNNAPCGSSSSSPLATESLPDLASSLGDFDAVVHNHHGGEEDVGGNDNDGATPSLSGNGAAAAAAAATANDDAGYLFDDEDDGGHLDLSALLRSGGGGGSGASGS